MHILSKIRFVMILIIICSLDQGPLLKSIRAISGHHILADRKDCLQQ